MTMHKSLVAQQALCNCELVQLNQPACSLDLAPSNYFLIRNMKSVFVEITEDRCEGMV